MQPYLKQIDKNTLIILYKLLHDSLFSLLVFFSFMLVAEAIIPDIIASHIGFSKLVFLILGNILVIKILAKKITLSSDVENSKFDPRKIAIPFSVLGGLLIINGQLGINFFLNLFIVLLSGAILYFSYQLLFKAD